eukprot:CAMPEP_0206142630 /NCGR_PEP_ID=MMETSP1473-20131121/17675_1 /ASSEMBLY_ACC=CAM_ASM_001109 /TAXON_ID=1461547 /ORGANISM="Stichococcus sp, Strain RCC1054" /LENGTH=319 /DNA_ID=CAMNT_0053537703 /DNA_START=96 /DNA_END=1055 /DNA_ORIENTATION=+
MCRSSGSDDSSHDDWSACALGHLSRRAVLLSSAAVVAAQYLKSPGSAAAVPIPPAPAVGNCPDCVGEVESTLNSCGEASPSCVSTSNDDEAHFLAPWSYDGSREKAIEHLITISTGGGANAGVSTDPLGISRSGAAGFLMGSVAAAFSGGNLPDQPKAKYQAQGSAQLFDGVVADRHTTKEGVEYVRVTFGTAGGDADDVQDPTSVVDAEFLFPSDDNIVVLRAASRAQPEGRGSLQLNFSKGLVFENNVSARALEQLRKALRWEVVPVITDFDPRFNSNKPLWFEKLYKPFVKLRYGRDFSQEVEDQSSRPLVDGRRV